MNDLKLKKEILWEEKNLIEQKNNCLNNNEIGQKDIINDINNDSMKYQCKDIGKISGIYKIINKINGKYYIGSSNDVISKTGRWYEHRGRLTNNNHFNKRLQNAWNKYGESNFHFVLIEQCNEPELLSIEQKYLNELRNDFLSGKDTHYNISYDATAPMKGKIPWNKGKTGLQTSHNKGKKLSLKTRQKISESTKISMAKISDRMSKVRTGKILSEEQKVKLSDPTIYSFYNHNTLEKFVGTRYEFRKKYNIDKACIWSLIKGKYKQTGGWILQT